MTYKLSDELLHGFGIGIARKDHRPAAGLGAGSPWLPAGRSCCLRTGQAQAHQPELAHKDSCPDRQPASGKQPAPALTGQTHQPGRAAPRYRQPCP